MNQTKIEWCDVTWNPVTGCLHGCPYCYARKIAQRFGKVLPDLSAYQKEHDGCHVLDNEIQNNPFPWLFEPTFHAARLNEPEQEEKPKNIFTVSMGDLFGDWVPEEWIREVLTACKKAPWHKYLFLTKNPAGIDWFIDHDSGEERGSSESLEYYFPFWFGTSVTCDKDMSRAEILSGIQEGHSFLSVEPLLGSVHLNLKKDRCPNCGSLDVYEDNPRTRGDETPIYCDDCGWGGDSREELKPGIEWVIIGAETGSRKGKIIPQREWIESIVSECRSAGVPVFMKGSLSKIWGAPLIQEFPCELIQEFTREDQDENRTDKTVCRKGR